MPDGPVAVVCGKGNNGGDGFVAARLLREAGREVDVLLLARRRDAAGRRARELRAAAGRAAASRSTPGALIEAAVIVDAMLGTGFARRAARARRRRDRGDRRGGARRPVVAADVPSGVDASTGEVAGAAVRAVATATFHAAKPGLWIAPGKEHAGEVAVVDIGIPRGGRRARRRASG